MKLIVQLIFTFLPRVLAVVLAPARWLLQLSLTRSLATLGS